jgi:CubicO group peptidase (beta-lactamase class C family)
MRVPGFFLLTLCLLAQSAAAEPLPGLESFVDGVMASVTTQRNAGVQVAIVKDGRALLVKGYGIAALRPERPVDPARSLFRLGSISKTFCWLALMQLEERGKLRLSDPVNQHLPPELAIPNDGWREPVRILDLMNHTAGFEEVIQGVEPFDEAKMLSLQQDLARFRPARVRRPGVLSVYSNYGAQLAGAIVAHVSGSDFETYIEQHVFGPLGMEHSTFREEYGPHAPRGLPAPMPKSLAIDRAAGIEWVDGAWRAFPHEQILAAASAGAASSTAADMARYMIALLDPPALERAGVLQVSTSERLRQPSFLPAPGVRGMHHGFFNAPGTRNVLGYANLSHGGLVGHFTSYMLVVPELGLGTFVATNSSGTPRLPVPFHELILRRYFPAPAQPALPAVQGDLREYAGDYRPMRRNYSKLEAIFSLDMVFAIDAPGDGSLLIRERPDDAARYVRIGRDLFQKVDSDARIAFLREPNGRVARVVGAANAERVRVFETALWLRGWSIAGLVVSLAILWTGRRGRRVAVERWVGLSAWTWLAFYVAAATWQLRYGFGHALDGYPQPILKLGLLLLMTAVATSALATLSLPLVWRTRSLPVGRRVLHTLALAVLIGTTLALHEWNALGLHYF